MGLFQAAQAGQGAAASRLHAGIIYGLRGVELAGGRRLVRDIPVPDLIDRAFKLKRDAAAAQYSDAELPLLMSGAGTARNDRSLREVHLG